MSPRGSDHGGRGSFAPLERKAPKPLYRQLEEALLEIARGGAEEGAPLPSEADLMAMFQVSRFTVRHALAHLAARGVLLHRRGQGRRILTAQRGLRTEISAWHSFQDEMERQGRHPVLFEVRTGFCAAEKSVAEALLTKEGARLPFLVRRYGYTLADQIDVVFTSCFPPSLGLEDCRDFLTARFEHLYPFLEKTTGCRATRSVDRIGAVPSAPELPVLQDNIPLLVRRRIVYDQDGRPLEYNTGYYRSDLFDMCVSSQAVL